MGLAGGVWSEQWGVDGLRDGFQRRCNELVRIIGKILRLVPGWSTSVAEVRIAGAASLAIRTSRSIPPSRRRWRSGGVGACCVGIGPLLEVIEAPLHDARVLDAMTCMDALMPRAQDARERPR